MKIKQFTEKYGITNDTARYYEAEGLLHPVRLDNGYRSYDAACEQAIKFITVLKEAGFSLHEIKLLLELEQRPPSEQCNEASVAMFTNKINNIKRQIAFYQAALHALQFTMEIMGEGKYSENQNLINQLVDDMYFSLQEGTGLDLSKVNGVAKA